MSWFHCSGGFSGFLDRRYGLQCPLLHQLKFPFESIASPSRPKHRRRRWYHRHYHRRVKFLHHPRPKLIKPVSLQLSRFRKSVCRPAVAVLSRVTNFAFRSCPSFLLRLPGLPVILAYVSHYLQSSFILRACCTYFSACYIFTTCYLAWCSRSRPFLHVFDFDTDADFGSELPFSVQEGELSNVGPSKVYSDRVENALLDLFCCVMAQSRAASSQSISPSWESVNPPRRHSLTVPDLGSFVSTLDPLADSKVLLEEEWHSLSVNTATSYLNPVPNLDHFVRNIDPLLHFRVSQLDFTLSSAPTASVHYNSDLMSKHVFLIKSEQSHLPIVIDTGASRLITLCRKDFISFENYSSTIDGIGSSTAVTGKGFVKWKITD